MISLNVYMILAPIAVIICVSVLVFIVLQKKRMFLFLECLLGCSILILLGNMLELCSKNSDQLIFFSRCTYVLIAINPVLWFLFALDFVGEWTFASGRMVILLLIIPFVTSVVVWTNPLHHLLWRENIINQEGRYLLNRVIHYGPWFWIHTAYCYLLYMAGCIVILIEYLQRHRLYRFEAAMFLAGITLPVLFNFSYVFRFSQSYTRDASPLVLALSCIFFAIGMIVHNKQPINPMPRSRLFESVEKCMLILNKDTLVIDANKTAAVQLHRKTENIIGQPLSEIFSPCSDNTTMNYLLSCGGGKVIWDNDNDIEYGHMYVSPICNKMGSQIGYSLSVFPCNSDENDVTDTVQINLLTARESQILDLIQKHLSNKEIAARLFISESTVKSHVHNLLKKGGVTRREDLRRENFKI